jgi:tripartite-type tricarboxylate transporter receptor subunit TctC
MTTSSSSPYRKLQDLIDSAKRNPGKLTYGTSGPGSSQEMLMRQLTDITKTEMVSVPFRGAGPALVEVVAGRLDSFLGPSGAVMPLANSNQVRILASTAPVRSAAIPDIPTFSELGFPLNLYGWLGVCTAKGTPPDIISTLNAKVTAITASAEYKRGLEATGQIPESTSPQELDKIMSGMTSEISDLVSKYGIRVD